MKNFGSFFLLYSVIVVFALLSASCSSKSTPTEVDPVASFSANPSTGDAVLKVLLSAEASEVPGGVVQRFEWDFDNDGVFELDTGNTATTDYYFYHPGSYPINMRVTDGAGLQDTATQTVTVEGAATWHVSTAATGADFTDAAVGDVDGQPGMYYTDFSVPDMVINRLLFQLATDAAATTWETAIELDRLESQTPVGYQCISPLETGGTPAAVFQQYYVSSGGGGATSWIARSDDSTGSTWTVEQILDSRGTLTAPVCSVAGLPALVSTTSGRGGMFLYFQMAETTALTTWTDLHDMPEGEFGGSHPVDAGGRPALAFISGEGSTSTLDFLRALDDLGTQWPTQSQTITTGTVSSLAMLNVLDRPVAAYHDATLQRLMYVSASSADGSIWGSPAIAANGVSASWAGDYGSNQTAIAYDGRPVVLCIDDTTGENCLIAANNKEATAWSKISITAPITVPRGITEVGGKFAFCFIDESGDGAVNLAMLY